MTPQTMFLGILTIWLSQINAQDIASLADQRCPCRVAAECAMNFAETNPLASTAVQQFIPACPALQGRCCSPETLLVIIIDLVQPQQFVQPLSVQSQFEQPHFEQPQFVQPQFNTQPQFEQLQQQQFVQSQFEQPHFEQPRFEQPQFVQHQFVQPQSVQSQFLQSEFEQSRSPPGGLGFRGSRFLSCVSVNQCPAGNIYGTDPSHFQEFGFISEEESDCPAREGEVLCIIQETAGEPSQELPCVQPSSCSEVYGEVSHIAEYGLQFSCDISTQVRCVSVTNTIPSNSSPPPPLPCVQAELCREVYGTVASHFTLYGVQNTCPAPDQVRCVMVITNTVTQPSIIFPSIPSTTLTTANPVFAELPCVIASSCLEEYGTQDHHFTTFGVQLSCSSGLVRCISHVVGSSTPTTHYHSTPTRGYSTTTRGYSSIHPLFTTQAPVTPPTAAVVNIIGPSPLYLGFGDNHGPSVHHSSESINGQAGGDKQQQIRALLELLDKRLKQIVKRLPNQHTVY